jgi:hypothetical protein
VLVGGAGAAWAFASPALPALSAIAQLDAAAGPAEIPNTTLMVVADSSARVLRAGIRACGSVDVRRSGQLVQLSVAGLAVAVAVPPVAVTPVSDGMEK